MAEIVKMTLPPGKDGSPRQVEFEPRLPKSHTIRFEIAQVAELNALRSFGSALGACWPPDVPWPGQSPRPLRYVQFNQPALYAQAVVDDLVAGGVRMAEIMRAGATCYHAVLEDLYGEQEVAAAEDFFDGGGPPTA